MFDGILESGGYRGSTGTPYDANDRVRSKYKTKLKKGTYRVTCSDNPTTIAMTLYNDDVFVKEIAYTNNIYGFVLDADYEVNVTLTTTNINTKVQIEEGTVATPYEPYQEDKLTILSPVQLEKVGDVADRIIEKNGVWGVEKNIKTDLLKGRDNEYFRLNKVLDKGGYQFTWGVNMGAIANKNSEVISSTIKSYVVSNEEYSSNIWIYSGATYVIHHPTISTSDELKLWLQANPTTVKFASNTPQFIPLPHDQQVKLRTFANKTNISFLTEIEGTIKAQVPKSLGATVNTHTEQISNLNKELDRVKKLEESTVSTVETESDFTTVEATTRGYFDDVKLEGKTLVNLVNDVKGSTKQTIVADGSNKNISYKTSTALQIGKEYTFVVYISKNTLKGDGSIYLANSYTTTPQVEIPTNSVGLITRKITISNGHLDRGFQQFAITKKMTSGEIEIDYYMVLEGDHTQNPPSGYIEGLKSVGQSATTSEGGVGEISVASVNENLIPNIKLKKGGADIPPYNDLILDNTRYRSLGDFIFLPKGEYCINANQSVSSQSIAFKVKDMFGKDIIGVTDTPFTFNNPINQYVYIFGRKGGGEWDLGEYPSDIGLTLTKGKDLNSYTPHQSNKKRLLYYNTETQTWENPILRQWDGIEKHANGKYYYHQRSGEAVLNGSENWVIRNDLPTDNPKGTHLVFYVQDENFPIKVRPNDISSVVWISDIIQPLSHTQGWNTSTEGLHFGTFSKSQGVNNCRYYINITKSKLSTQDVAGFKQWLQTNNITVVYQLAKEKIYECTNIDLITYNSETNFIVESGAIAPRITLKVHNNISNVVNILQKKVSLLEDKFIQGLKQVLAGDMYSLAELLYPEDFVSEESSDVPTLLI